MLNQSFNYLESLSNGKAPAMLFKSIATNLERTDLNLFRITVMI